MAAIDYGAIVIKNGKIINTGMFEDMKESVGWSDEKRIYYSSKGVDYSNQYLANNYFAYIGDSDLTLAFYKRTCRVSWKDNQDIIEHNLDWASYYESSHIKSRKFTQRGVTFRIREISSSVYLCSLDYKGDHYNVIFGYGIDIEMDIWNKVKNSYLGKKDARKVDNLLKRLVKEQ